MTAKAAGPPSCESGDTAIANFDDMGKPDSIALAAASEELRRQLEALALAVRDIVLQLPPTQLLGWVWATVHMRVLADVRQQGDDYRPDKSLIADFQFALEYLHAVWSCHANLAPETTPFDETKAVQLMSKLEELQQVTSQYCMTSSLAKHRTGHNEYITKLEFEAKSAWVMIRGHRYQVLENEFFSYVLATHADALQAAYGMTPDAIAEGMQAIADRQRTGMSDAVQKLIAGMERANALIETGTKDLGAGVEALRTVGGDFSDEMAGAIADVFHGGICNLSRHSNFTSPLLADLSFQPGENTEFFAEGPLKGTALRTLPARVKPGIKLGESYYSTDGQFIRDSAYRTIQRGLLARLPDYRDEWRIRQQDLVEKALHTICARQLGQSNMYQSVFYPDPATGEMCECDLIMTLDDVLIIVEGKAGAMPMHSPETNFDRFERLIGELIVKAYAQCKRFLDHLASAPEVEIFQLANGRYVPTAKLRLRHFRTILPIGLTVEAFTPFSAMVKARPDIQPLLGRHPFISMSVDDLFVLNRFLPTAGELLHYLQVRQRAAGLPAATIFDEIDHLGAYISRNRFDMEIEKHLQEADVMWMDSFCDVVDQHFEGRDWATDPVPCQPYPAQVAAVLTALDEIRPVGWLAMDTMLRDQGSAARDAIAEAIARLLPELRQQTSRRFMLGEEPYLEIWICRKGSEPTGQVARKSGQISCLVANAQRVALLVISYFPTGKIADVECHFVGAPSMLQVDYGELSVEAERRNAAIRPFCRSPNPNGKGSRYKRGKKKIGR